MAKQKLPENEWVYVKDSGIHGSGVFAKRNIPEKTLIMEYLGERISKEESERRGLEQMDIAEADSNAGAVYIFHLDDDWDIDGNVPENMAKFANHSCEENCEAYDEDGRIFYYAIDDIAEGEEILIDYGYAIEHFQDHRCLCGANRCAGYIVNKDDRPKLKKLLNKKKKKSLLKKGKKKRKSKKTK